MDNSQIQKILEDLYQIDPSFRAQEKDLKNLLVKLVASRPDTKFDQNFALNLKQQLMTTNQLIKEPNNMNDNSSLSFFKKPVFALVGLGALAIVLVLVSQYDQGEKTTEQGLLGNLKINRVGDNAFSSLLSFAQTSPQADATQELDKGADSSNTATSVLSPVERSESGGFGGGGGGTGVDIFPPEIVNYVYVYRGEEFTIDQAQMEVLKRIKTPFADSELVNVIQNSSLGLVDLSRFVNARIQSLNIYEDRDGGYEAWIDFLDGRISINQRYTDPIAYEQPSILRLDDVPADSSLIEVARNFLTERGVNLDSYGQPFVRKDW